MSRSHKIKDLHLEYRIFSGRIILVVILTVAITIALASRLAWLQIHSHGYYSNLAEDNRVKLSPIPPSRGLIYDRNGDLLAENLPGFSLEITPEEVKDMPALLRDLSQVLNVAEKDILDFEKLHNRLPGFESIPLRLNLSEEEVAAFEVTRYRFPGTKVVARLKRNYPYGELFAHVLGYVGRINEQELNQIDEGNYRGTNYIGKLGVEKYYETILHGKSGVVQEEVNSKGRPIRILEEQPATAGDSLILSIDAKLQKVAIDALGDYSGSVVALDPRNGEILAMASTPSYDANMFVGGISNKAYQSLRNNPERPLYDRALRGQYPPGSTIKPVIALAGLEFDKTTPWRTIRDPGFFKLPKQPRKYRDWKKGGHGMVDLDKAITQSCDTYFYDLANRLGIDNMHDMGSRFRLGQKTGIDLPGEASGLMPSRQWKRKRHRQPWFPGETLIVGIGQGYMLTTPLQLATVASCIAMRGACQTPHILKTRLRQGKGRENKTVEGWMVALKNSNNWDHIIQGMVHVMHGKRGTGRRAAAGAKYQIAGKTGTAQVFSLKDDEEYEADKLARHLLDHALFIAFAPVENPQIAIAVVVEHGGHGGATAAPIARQVMDAWLLKDEKKNGPTDKQKAEQGG
ncbi:MAG TPA: penicillin-binding protein 2 [Chromatiales bacterium]|nr:penicillin-binding protein 2 [Thiotrichales bacterium]HIP68577.1 penicillin-binding protein 2 [Chromatiales bacterium]